MNDILPLRDYPFDTRPMIIAHRGDTTHGARENTPPAIEAAVRSGADMVEVDVQWSADEVFVCYHDIRFPSSDRNISELTYAELQALGIASLQSIIRAARTSTQDRSVYFNIEVKEYSSRDPKQFMDALSTLLQAEGIGESVLVSSFRIDYIREAGWEIPTVIIHPDAEMQRFFDEHSASPAGVVLDKPVSDYLPSELLVISRATSYACHLNELTSERRQDIAKYNILLSVYTVETEPEFHHAVLGGARALVCEQPARFVALRNKLFASS